MTNNAELVTIVIPGSGLEYSGWKTFSVTASIKEAARTFKATTTDRSFGVGVGAELFSCGEVEIRSNGDLLVKGYVDSYEPQINPTDHPVAVSGRGKGGDFIDCAAEHKKGYEENASPDALAKKLDKFGVGIKASEKMNKVPMMQVNPGESAFETTERYTRQQGFVMCGQADGSIEITKAKNRRHAGGLVEGGNIIDGSAPLTNHNRHSDYKVKGSGRLGSKKEQTRPEDDDKDEGVKRYRPKIIVHEGDADKGRCKIRAKSEKDRRAGESRKAKITVQGFRDEAGELFEPNRLIYVSSASLGLEQDMLIEKIELSQSAEGDQPPASIAKLDLVDPRAYGGKKPGTTKSNKVWTGGFRESDPVGVGDGSL